MRLRVGTTASTLTAKWRRNMLLCFVSLSSKAFEWLNVQYLKSLNDFVVLLYIAVFQVQCSIQRRKLPTISVRPDFLKCAQIFFSSKTRTLCVQIYCTDLCCLLKNLDTFSVQIGVFEERKMWTHLRKSGRADIVGSFQLQCQIKHFILYFYAVVMLMFCDCSFSKYVHKLTAK